MAIKVGGNTVIDDSRNFTGGVASNIGSGTKDQLQTSPFAGSYTGEAIFCTDLGDGQIVYWDGTEWAGTGSITATGGTKTNIGSKTYHTFTGTGTFVVSGSGDVEYVLVGGGGGTGPTGPTGPQGDDGATGSVDLSYTGGVPAGASAGDLWFDSNAGVFSVYIDDGDSQQWVELAGKQGVTGPTGDAGSGGLFDNIFNEADPYLTAAKTFLDGSYELFVGTPGRQASVKKNASGTTSTSICCNQNEHAKYVAAKAIREQNPDIDEEELQKQVDASVKAANSGKNDTGSLVADHTSYAGNYTEETHGDNCKQIDGDHVVNVDGDYFLKITGDCHVEVGGGFFFDAEGAPKVVDKKGNKKNEKVQKHTIKFGSDVDINTVGAKFEVQGAEFNVGSVSTKFTSSVFESSGGQAAISAGEVIISGDNSIDLVTPSLVEMINTPPSPIPKAITGIRRMLGGSVETIMTPGMSADAIPRYIIANPLGPYSLTCGATGYNCNVLTGPYNVNVTAGFIFIDASLACTILCGTGMLLEATGGMMLLGKTIFIN